jgi:hypothetical protein
MQTEFSISYLLERKNFLERRMRPMEILENIPVSVSIAEVKRRLHLSGDQEAGLVQELVNISLNLIEAKALYKICYVDEKLEDAVGVNQLVLKSRVLRKNLDQVERFFPYVVTIGSQFETEMRNCPDILKKYYLDIIGTVALTSARKHLEDHLRSTYALGKMAFMSPGSLPDWPIAEQRPLFKLLGDVEGAIGVKLTASLLMLPAKSVSGIYFPTEITFYSCQLCPREDCVGRKARYDEKRAREYGILK